MAKRNSHTMPTKLWELYSFIEERTNTGVSTSCADICAKFPNRYAFNPKQCNYSNCPTLYDAIWTINNTYRNEHDKYILTNNNNFKLATYEELSKEYNKIMKRYKKCNAERKTMLLLFQTDNQAKLLSKDLNPIDEKSKAKPIVESFSKK